MPENIHENLTAILMQELFENGLFDINELTEKYTFSEELKEALTATYNQYYKEEE